MNLTEVILALTIILLMLASIANFMHIGTEKNVQKRVAEEAQEIARAADEYAQKYHARLMPNLTPTSGRSITIRDLVNDNFLKPGTAEENIWGQTYGIYFRRVDTTVPDGMGGTKDDHGIRVVVLTEGGVRGADDEIFVNKIVPGVIPFMSVGAGFTPSGVLPNQPRGSLVGTGWTMDLNSMGVPDPGPGHIGVVSTFNTPAIAHDFLYRKDIGIEELNTMETEMHMDDHAILATKEIRFIPHTLAEMDQFCTNNPEDSRLFQLEDNGLYLCRKGRVAAAPFAIQEVMDTGNVLQIKDIRLVGNGDIVTKPDCAPNTNTSPEIILTPVAIASKMDKTPPITAFQAYAIDNADSWSIQIRHQDAKSKVTDTNMGWRHPNSSLVMAQAISLCRSTTMTP